MSHGEVIPKGELEFDLRRVATAIEASLAVEGKVHLAHYLESYRQLNRLFPKLGVLFGFIEKDVRTKVDQLAPVAAANPNIDVKAAFLDGVKVAPVPPSLVIVFMRLFRAYDFIIRVVKDVIESEDDDSMGPVARKAYDATLGRYHIWAVRKAIHLAFKTLGTRRDLAPVLVGDMTPDQASAAKDRIVAGGRVILQRLEPHIAANPLIANINQQA